jgi:hypothetical protein
MARPHEYPKASVGRLRWRVPLDLREKAGKAGVSLALGAEDLQRTKRLHAKAAHAPALRRQALRRRAKWSQQASHPPGAARA